MEEGKNGKKYLTSLLIHFFFKFYAALMLHNERGRKICSFNDLSTFIKNYA
jgi:hypothetical protein